MPAHALEGVHPHSAAERGIVAFEELVHRLDHDAAAGYGVEREAVFGRVHHHCRIAAHRAAYSVHAEGRQRLGIAFHAVADGVPLRHRRICGETREQRAENEHHQREIDQRKDHPPLFDVAINVHHQIFSVHIYPVALMVLRQPSSPYSASILRKRKMFISMTEVPVVE